MMVFCDTGGLVAITLTFIDVQSVAAIILSGAPNSYARYPKWAHSFENSLSFEFKTKQSHGLLLYTDDGAVNGNFYSISISDGRIQLDFRLGDNLNDFGPQRLVNTIRIEEVRVDDNRWHSLALFQSWENVKLELDASLVFKILNQRSFIFGNILKNSDVFVGGVPQRLPVELFATTLVAGRYSNEMLI
ncbi:LamG [Parelaphostrongylus tenuis]|uniref:LamG n=1 Tax=Parelaphostrongylus tenuis TaxID=148309 RepID=A0AAD5WHS2_PARTN|nr:LamG [Parelaphostrongylus tenuis]